MKNLVVMISLLCSCSGEKFTSTEIPDSGTDTGGQSGTGGQTALATGGQTALATGGQTALATGGQTTTGSTSTVPQCTLGTYSGQCTSTTTYQHCENDQWVNVQCKFDNNGNKTCCCNGYDVNVDIDVNNCGNCGYKCDPNNTGLLYCAKSCQIK